MDVLDNLCRVVIKNLKAQPGFELAANTRLVEDLGFDSLRLMQLLTDLEDEFDIFLPEVDLSKMRSIGDLGKIVEQGRLLCA